MSVVSPGAYCVSDGYGGTGSDGEGFSLFSGQRLPEVFAVKGEHKRRNR